MNTINDTIGRCFCGLEHLVSECVNFISESVAIHKAFVPVVLCKSEISPKKKKTET